MVLDFTKVVVLFPCFPRVRLIPRGCVTAIPYDRSPQEQRVFEEFVFDIMDQIFQVFLRICLALAVNKVINAHRCLEAVQLSFAQPSAGEIDEWLKEFWEKKDSSDVMD